MPHKAPQTESELAVARAHEQLRALHDRQHRDHMSIEAERRRMTTERMRHGRAQISLRHTLITLRWGAIVMLAAMVREIWEPARYALVFPNSWAHKIAIYAANLTLVQAWFTISGALLLPLICVLCFSPGHRLCHRMQDLAVGGLFGGAFGYAFMTSAAMRLDVPHVVDSYMGSTLVLAVTAVLVANWHNSRVTRAEEVVREGLSRRCNDMAH